MRVVLDTNILLPSIGSRSPLRWIFDALLDGTFTLIASTPILLEYEEVIGEQTTPEIVQNVLHVLLTLPNVERVAPRFRWRLIRADPDDDKFVDAYLAAGAEALVSHDAHFDVLADLDFPRVTVLSAEEFREALAPAP